jgi:hypothetical protein
MTRWAGGWPTWSISERGRLGGCGLWMVSRSSIDWERRDSSAIGRLMRGCARTRSQRTVRSGGGAGGQCRRSGDGLLPVRVVPGAVRAVGDAVAGVEVGPCAGVGGAGVPGLVSMRGGSGAA